MLLSLVDLIVFLCFAAQFAIAGYYFYLLYWMSELGEAETVVAPLPDDLPRVLVQLPVYNESNVVERALAAAGALDWPRVFHQARPRCGRMDAGRNGMSSAAQP